MAMGQFPIMFKRVVAICEFVLAVFNETHRGPVRLIPGQEYM